MGQYSGTTVYTAMPQTYVNLSGGAVLSMLTAFRLKPEDLLLIFDDAELPFGRLRFRRKGGSGGHNGLKSVIETIGESFVRLKVGIGRPESETGTLSDHVLSRFGKIEEKELTKVLDHAVDGIETFIKSGINTAMEQYNAYPCSGNGPNS